MATHLKVLAVIALVVGALGLITTLLVTLVFGGVSAAIGASSEPNKAIPLAILGLTGLVVTVYFAITSLVGIICGVGLLKRRRWARILGIIWAAVSLISFPVGTILGVYALWVLFNKETEALFGVGAAS